MARTKTIITMLYDLLNLSDIRKPEVVVANPPWQSFGKIVNIGEKTQEKGKKADINGQKMALNMGGRGCGLWAMPPVIRSEKK